MYRLFVESLLGLTREKDRLRFAPCIPASWPAFTVRYRYRKTVYVITVQQVVAAGERAGATSVTLNGVAQPDNSVALAGDRDEYHVVVLCVR